MNAKTRIAALAVFTIVSSNICATGNARADEPEATVAAAKGTVPFSLGRKSGQSPPIKQPPLSYSRDIRPIFANSCFTCHGADPGQRKADLRLDVRAVAVKEAIVPGKA